MPRSMAPPPSGEFSIRLTRSFGEFPSLEQHHGFSRGILETRMINAVLGKTPTEKVEFIGEPNRSASVKVTNHTGAQNQTVLTKSGSVQAYVYHPHFYHSSTCSATKGPQPPLRICRPRRAKELCAEKFHPLAMTSTNCFRLYDSWKGFPATRTKISTASTRASSCRRSKCNGIMARRLRAPRRLLIQPMRTSRLSRMSWTVS